MVSCFLSFEERRPPGRGLLDRVLLFLGRVELLRRDLLRPGLVRDHPLLHLLRSPPEAGQERI